MKNLAYNLVSTFFLYYIGVTVHGSFKKGISINPNAFFCDDLKVLDNVVWWYDWGCNLDNIRQKSRCQNVDEYVDNHVPMTWGYGSYFQKYYLHDQAEFLLGFNEPNHKGQSNILAEDAARYWPEVEKLAAGRPLISPAAAPCGSNCNGDTKEWFDLFFKSCNGCRVDYLATHVYNCNVNKTMAFLEDLYKTYNRKIWLTEFACPYKTNPKTQLRYMQQLLPELEKADYIFRYAWFVSRVTEESASRFIPISVNIFESDSSNLTALGKFYNSFTSTETTTSTLTSSTLSSTTTDKASMTTTDDRHQNTTVISTSGTTTDDGIFVSAAIKTTYCYLLIINILIPILIFI